MPNTFDSNPTTSNVFDGIPAAATNDQLQVDDIIRRLLNPLSIAPALGIQMPSQYGSSYIGPPDTQNTDEPTAMVAPKGKNPFDASDASDASDGSLPNFANLPGQLKLDPLQQVQMQSGLVDPENAGATLANLLHGNDDAFLQTVAPHITAAAHALSNNPVTRGIGYGLNFAGQAIKGDGPAIRTEPVDHAKTASHGRRGLKARAYRARQKALIEQGKFEEALQMDIRDIRSKFGAKYDEGIKQLLKYYKTIPRWKLKLH